MRIALLSLTGFLLSAPAFAADLGTYRPGTPYHSVIVPTANVCESQCAGDARCRGWNYVKPSPEAAGVCEFQSQIGSPISSAISISGVSPSAMPMSNRVIAGGTNTVRVGTSIPPRSDTQASQASISHSPSGRQIIRHAVPQQIGGQPSSYRAPVQPAPTHPSGLRPMLESAGQAVPPRQAMPTYRGPARVNRQMVQPQRFQAMTPTQPQAGFVGSPYAAASQGRPPIGQPIPAPSIQAHMSPQRQVQPSAPAMPRASVANPPTWSNQPQPRQPQSLYGRLHDDVQAPGAQPSGQLAGTAYAPAPTAQARPVAPVTQTQLAGAYPRN